MVESISVIVATYNREDALEAVLRSLSRQSDREFEVVVADDGSRPATADLVEAWKSRMPVPLRHVWHEESRLSPCRDQESGHTRQRRGLLHLSGRRLHRATGLRCRASPARRAGTFVTGNRVLLSRGLSEHILSQQLEPECWSLRRLIARRCQGHINRAAPLVRLPLGAARKLAGSRWRGARGSNMAFFRDNLVEVDGFDAAFTGWGRRSLASVHPDSSAPESGARMVGLRPGFRICGIPKTSAPSLRKTRRSSIGCCDARACGRCRVCRRCPRMPRTRGNRLHDPPAFACGYAAAHRLRSCAHIVFGWSRQNEKVCTWSV